MKGYQVDNTVYIFPNQEAAAIPEQENATMYLVQYDELDAYKAVNETLADKLFGYNYNTITATPKVWKDHQDDELHKSGPAVLTLVYADGCEQYINEEWRYNTVENNKVTSLLAPEDNKFFYDDTEIPKYDVEYTGGEASFSDLNWLNLDTHVEDESITEVTLTLTPKSQPEANSITGADIDENTGLFETITVSLSNSEPLVTEYEEGNDYSPFEAANALYISSGDITDSSKYTWTKDGEPIEGVLAEGDSGAHEPLVYTYAVDGEDAPMFTVEENEDGTTATITPDATGVFVATAITEPEPDPEPEQV